jgi:glycosyltransferase involved in cell wall biosynthesis
MQAQHVRLHLVGDHAQNASYTQEIRALIRQAHLQDTVILHGAMPQPALFELLPRCDLYLSASSYESYSMATAEAAAHGLPIVAYATGAIADWVEDGVNGRLIALGQAEQFAQALTRLLTERHELNRLRNNAWARSANLALHSWEKTYSDFLQAFKSG